MRLPSLLVVTVLLAASSATVTPVTASETPVGATEPSIELVGLETPDRARVGDQMVVEATVRNRNDAFRSATVEYRIKDMFVTEKPVSLAPGETRTLRLTATIPELGLGEFPQSVHVESGVAASTTLHVESPGRDPAPVEIADLQGPLQASGGDSITAEATVEYAGTDTRSRTVEYRIGDRLVDTRRIAPEDDPTVSFEGTVPDLSAGTYRQGVYVAGRSVNRTATIRVGEAAFAVTAFWGPDRGRPGEEITARATIINTGTVAGSTELQYRLDGRTYDIQTVTLAPNASSTVTFTVTLPDESAERYRHGVYVGNDTSGLTGSVAVDSPSPSVTSGVTPASGAGFTLGSALVAMGVIGLSARKRTT